MKAGSGIEGFWLGNYMARIGLVQKLKLVRQVAKLVKRGLLTSEIGKTYSLQDVSAAVLEAERPGRSGKVLLKIGIE
jgi:NADPH:quinone reductase-like Zn-dependent oxidoreductase